MGGDFFDGAILNPAQSFEQAGDADGVVAAGFIFVGEEVGLATVFGNRSGAAFENGGENVFDGVTDVEDAGAKRTQETFVAGRGKEIDVVGLEINGNVSGR